MTILPVLQNTLQQTWTKFKAAALEAKRDDSGQAALVIITIVIVAAGIAISQMSVVNNRRSLEVVQGQRANFDKITNAIDSYGIRDEEGTGGGNYRIPCPATFAGNGMAQAFVGGDCTGATSNRGIVPWVTLGLAEEDVIDVNGNYLTYIVDQTEVEACNATAPTAVSLTNQGLAVPTADANYAIISHGNNGFGAFNSSSGTQVNGAGVGTNESDNCPSAGACAGAGADSYRTGPTDDTIGATFFDDVVRGVSFAESFTDECQVLNTSKRRCADTNDKCIDFTGGEEGQEAPVIVYENARADLDATRQTQGTANNAGNLTNGVAIQEFDPDGMADSGDETIAFSFINNDNFATRGCRFLEPTLPLTDHTIRIYARVFFEEDMAGDQGIGNGLVFGFLGHKDTAGDAVFVDNTTCGGTDSAMGFGEDSLGNTFATNIERFGVEVDTFEHRPAVPVTATDIYDPDFNHFAIVLGNVNHEDGDAHAEGETTGAGTGSGDDGPVCRALTSVNPGGDGDIIDSFGTPLENRGGVGTGTFAGNRSVSATTAGEACIYNELDINWLENGHPTTEGTFTEGNDVRIEIHGEAGNDCGAGQVLLSAWIYEASENCTTCSDVFQDFADMAPAGDLPHISQCINNNDLVAAADDADEDLHGIRLFLSQGFAASGAGIGGRTSIDSIIIQGERIDGAVKPVAADTAQTIDVTEHEVREYFYNTGIPVGNLLLDQSFVRINQATGGTQTSLLERNYDDAFDTGISIFSVRGSVTADLNDGIGIVGIGLQNFEVDTIDPSNVGIYADFDDYLDVNDRERLSFEFDQQYRRFTVNLRNFGGVTNNDYILGGGTESERVLIRAFNGDSQVGSTQTFDVDDHCPANIGNNGNGAGMTINLDFGGLFDRVQIIPDPAEPGTTVIGDDARSGFIVGAFKACGADRPCGFNPQGNEGDETTGRSFNDTNINNSEAECHSITTWPVTTSGIGASSEIDLEKATFYINRTTGTANLNTQRTWIDFNDYDTDEGGAGGAGLDANAMDVNVMSPNGRLQLHRTSLNGGVNAAANGYFGVIGPTSNTARIDSNDALPAGEEEELRFRFNNDWNRAMVRITRFSDLLGAGGGDREQAVISLHNDGSDTPVAGPWIVEACPLADTNANWRKEIQIDPTVLTSFDEIRVSANATTGTSTSSEIGVHAIRACDLASGLDCGGVAYGDSGTLGTRYCTEVLN